MAKRIEAQEVIQPDLFKNTIASAEQAEASLKSFSGELGRVIKLQAEIANSTKRNAKGYQELAAAEERSKIALTEKEKIDNRILTIQKQLTSVNKLQREQLAALTAEQQRRNKVAKQEAILANENINAYDKLQVKIKMLSDRYRGLIAAEGKETAQSKLLRKEILALNAVRDKSNEALGMHQNKVGQYGRSLSKLTSILSGLGLAFGVFSLLRNTFGIMSDFEKATASLSAITGATGGELESLKGTILDLATEMKVGVTETTKLFEIVGSQMPQLLKDADGLRAVSESSIVLSKASGETIESSTLAMAAVMNQFSLEATEANRVMNVLAAGSLVGSAGISDVSEAMKNFGSVAAGANITVEESVALIEVLGKFGVVGAESGTKLRGSILKLQQASFGYASGQFEVNDALTEAKAKMDSLGSAMEQDAFLQKTFGAENISTGRILLSNIGLFEEYTKGVTGTNVATEQAAINSDTMSVALQEMKAAWENAIIEVTSGTNAGEGFKEVIKSITEIIPPLVRGLGEVLKNVAALIKLMAGMKSTWSNAFTSVKAFGNALADTLDLLLGWIPGMKQMNDYMLRQKDALVNLTAEQQRNNFVNSEAIKQGNEILKQNKEEISDVSVLLDALMDENTTREEKNEIIAKLQADYPDYVKNIDLETASTEQLIKAKKDLITQLLNEAIERKKAEQIALRTDKIIELELQKIGANANGIKYLDKQIQDLYATLPLIEDIATKVSDNVKSTVESLDVSAAFRDTNDEVEKLQFRIAELKKDLYDGATTNQEATIINQEIEKANAELERLLGTRKRMLDDALDKEATGGGIGTGSGGSGGGGGSNKKAEFIFPEAEKALPPDAVFDTNFSGKIIIRPEDIIIPSDEELGLTTEDLIPEEVFVSWQEKLQKIIEATRDTVQETLTMISDMMQANISMIDSQIAAQQNALQQSMTREQELRDIAKERKLDATESIEAERDAQKKALGEIEKLEAKKRQLEMMIAAMQLLSQGKSVSDIKGSLSDIKSFVEGSFYEGTPYTIADSLGRTGTRDGHIVRVDDNEAVLTGEQTRALGIGKGGNTTQDIVDKFGILGQSLRLSMPDQKQMLPATTHDRTLAKKLDQTNDILSTLPDKMPKYDSLFNSQVGYFEWVSRMKRKTTKTRYIPKR